MKPDGSAQEITLDRDIKKGCLQRGQVTTAFYSVHREGDLGRADQTNIWPARLRLKVVGIGVIEGSRSIPVLASENIGISGPKGFPKPSGKHPYRDRESIALWTGGMEKGGQRRKGPRPASSRSSYSAG